MQQQSLIICDASNKLIVLQERRLDLIFILAMFFDNVYNCYNTIIRHKSNSLILSIIYSETGNLNGKRNDSLFSTGCIYNWSTKTGVFWQIHGYREEKNRIREQCSNFSQVCYINLGIINLAKARGQGIFQLCLNSRLDWES